MRYPNGWENLINGVNLTLYKAANHDTTYILFEIIIILVAVLLFILLVAAFVIKVKEFFKELQYINIEIKRNSGAERKYWILRRKKLWLSFFIKMK